jgi:tRNA-dihydrouridine synthase A
VHARIAVLDGLSPKQNREIPPLRYADVYRLKAERPHLRIELNGGIRSLDAAEEQLQRVDGVMIGRAVMDEPMLLADVDRRLFADPTPPIDRPELVERVAEYVGRASVDPGFRPRWVHRHLSSLFVGVPGARAWRRTLSEQADDPDAMRIALAAATRRARVYDESVSPPRTP